MAQFAVAGRTTIAPTSALPAVSVYNTATVRARITEIHLFNTTATACVVALQRFSTAGTQGAGLTEVGENFPEHPAIATAFAGHTVGPTITAGEIRRAQLGAAIGAGVIWTFGSTGVQATSAVTAGLGITCPTGTGQILDYVISWIE